MVGKGLHTQLSKMKEMLQMKEMKKQDLDKQLKAEKKKKIKKSDDFDLFAQMAKLSSKNEKNVVKTAVQPEDAAKKKQMTIEEIERRDKEREREQRKSQGEWQFFQAKPTSGTIMGSLGSSENPLKMQHANKQGKRGSVVLSVSGDRQAQKQINAKSSN